MGRASCPGGWVAVGVESSLLSPTLPWGESGELSWWWWPQQRDLVELGVTLDYPPALIHWASGVGFHGNRLGVPDCGGHERLSLSWCGGCGGRGRLFSGDTGCSVFGGAVSWSVGRPLLEASRHWQQFKGVINHEVHCAVICFSSRVTNLSSLSRISSMIALKTLHPRNSSVLCKPGTAGHPT